MKPDWFVLGADRSAKWHGETVDSHHKGGKKENIRLQNTNRLYFLTKQATHVERNIEARSCHRCRSVEAVRVTYSECWFVALGIQHAVSMRRIILSSVACPTLPYFPKLSHKRQDFRRRC